MYPSIRWPETVASIYPFLDIQFNFFESISGLFAPIFCYLATSFWFICSSSFNNLIYCFDDLKLKYNFFSIWLLWKSLPVLFLVKEAPIVCFIISLFFEHPKFYQNGISLALQRRLVVLNIQNFMTNGGDLVFLACDFRQFGHLDSLLLLFWQLYFLLNNGPTKFFKVF